MTEEEADRLNNIRDSAEKKLEESQSELNRIDEMGNQARTEVNRNLSSWQSWLGAIAFSLAAVSGVVLTGQSQNYWALIATIIFLGTGVSIAVTIKRRVEKDSIIATEYIDTYRPLVDKEKELAWQIYRDPTVYEVVNPKLEIAMREKVKFTLGEIEGVISTAEKSGVNYSSDIWLASVTTGIYLLLINPGLSFYTEAHLTSTLIPYVFGLPWILLMLIILNDALKTATLIKTANIRHLIKWRGQQATYKRYLKKMSGRNPKK